MKNNFLRIDRLKYWKNKVKKAKDKYKVMNQKVLIVTGNFNQYRIYIEENKIDFNNCKYAGNEYYLSGLMNSFDKIIFGEGHEKNKLFKKYGKEWFNRFLKKV